MPKPIILFEDKLGISQGYEYIWDGLLAKVGLIGVPIYRRNSFRKFGNSFQLLTRKGNRKAPGFNPDIRIQRILVKWIQSELKEIQPGLCIVMDPAILFILNPDWNQATIDNLRGGVYYVDGVPFLVSFPISAWHNQKKEKDIARLNEGFTDEDEWEAEHGGDETDGDSENMQIWLEPMAVPYGKFVLQKDLEKAKRVYERAVKARKESA